MITEELELLVKDEAENLKKYALPRELAKLSFSKLFPWAYNKCIYGQMTGNCHSERAKELLSKCAIPYSVELKKRHLLDYKMFEYVGATRNFSAIEFYIAQDDSSCELLINFLQGRSEVLEL